MQNFDVAIIGSGPGGYVVAIRLAQLKKKVVLIEKENLGGICLNWGCIPTKSFLKSADIYQSLRNASEYGLSAKNVNFDISEIVKKSREISGKLTSGIKSLLKKNGVKLIKGYAKLLGNSRISVNDSEIKASTIIIATGAKPTAIKGFEPNGKNIWTYKEALLPKKIPKSMVIIGSGAIGIEFASFYNSFGTNVTVVDLAERIVPSEDHEISSMAQKLFEKKGIKFKTSASLEKYSQEEVYFKDGAKYKAEILLVAAGVTGNIDNIGIENTKIQTKNNLIVTNNLMQTNEENIYAIGDVAGIPQLAHKASHEAIYVADIICNKDHSSIIDKNNIPRCTYSTPQIASIGLTEEQAKVTNDIKVGRFPFYANGKALIDKSDGMVKTIFDAKTGEILGVHMIGKNVSELIGSISIAKQAEATKDELINTIMPHPTLSEIIHESTLDADNSAIHI